MEKYLPSFAQKVKSTIYLHFIGALLTQESVIETRKPTSKIGTES